MAFTIDSSIPPTILNVGQVGVLQLNMAADSTPAPLSWSATGLPDGVAISDTGKVFGAPTYPGVFDVVATATNGGNSDSVSFQIGVSDRFDPVAGLEGAIELNFEIRTGGMAVPNVVPGAGDVEGEVGPLLYVARGDRPQFAVAAIKDGLARNLDMVDISLGLKRYETEDNLVVSDGLFYRVGAGEFTRWVFDTGITPDAVNAVLSEEEDEEGTFVNLWAELELKWNWWPPGTDPFAVPAPTPRVIRRTSQLFKIRVARDFLTEE